MNGAGDQAYKAEHVRAAQYVLMSTEHQKYSTENQAIEIARYARDNGYVIVKTYMDSGKVDSNLTAGTPCKV
jgi:DNA invertase Pin-like site-specific DNA recombinase